VIYNNLLIVKLRSRQGGFTLIELVVALVIIAAAASTIVGLMASISSKSAEAMQQVQAVAIADAYMREIISRPFTDPAAPYNELNRAGFDDVNDYEFLNEIGARDRTGIAIPRLQDYQIFIRVEPIPLGPGGAQVAAGRSRQITVRATSPSGRVVVLSAFRTLHP
jgi:MSHA pilin protein MshD